MGKKPKRKSAWVHDPEKVAAAERTLRQAKSLLRDPGRLIRELAEGKSIRLPLRSELGVMASLLGAVHRGDFDESLLKPDVEVLHRLLLFCRDQTDLLTDQQAPRYGNALLALAAHHEDWIRPLEQWHADSHNTGRQFRCLLRHLIARYDIPVFMDTAWLEGLTSEGVKHQGWYKQIAQGRNIRTAEDLPIPLTKKQAHHFLQAPDDFDIPSAFRWAVVIDLGGDERLVRSILGTRIGTSFGAEAFWASVFRFFLAHPSLDPRHHGPIIDYLLTQKFVPSIPNPRADQADQPPLVAPQPNLCMKGRTPESLLRAVSRWHRSLVTSRMTPVPSWAPSGFPPLVFEEVTNEGERRYEVVELLAAQEMMQEGRAMHHCVASYTDSCASGRTSIWSLRKRIEAGRFIRMATIEVSNKQRAIVQVRRRCNKRPSKGEMAILRRWEAVGGPKLSYWLST